MNIRPFVRPLWLVGLLLAVTLVLLLLLLHPPRTQMFDLGTGHDAPVLVNFFSPERDGTTTFRWSMPGSRLLLHPGYTGPLLLEARLHGGAEETGRPRRLYLQQAGTTLAHLDIASGWRVYRVLLPASRTAATSATVLPLDLIMSEYRSAPRDPRRMGVPVDWLGITALERPALLNAAALQQIGVVAWGLALLAGGGWLLDAMFWAGNQAGKRALRVGVGVGVAAVGVLIWLTRHPYGILLALPLLVRWVGAGSLVLLVGWGCWRRGHPVIGHMFRACNDLRMLVGLVLLAHLLLVLPLPVAVRGTIALVLLGLPGALLALRLFPTETDPLTRLFLGLCGGLILAPLLLLALQAVPGPVPWWGLLFATDALMLFLGWELFRTRLPEVNPAPGQVPVPGGYGMRYMPLVMLFLLGAALRLTFLGSAEYQGDEGRAVLMAAGLLHGQDEILLLHKKGPMEILLPAGPLVVTGQLNEWVARLPFALAGMGILLGSYLLARQMFNDDREAPESGGLVGGVAVAILAVDGFLIAFSRIVQYQSIVVVTGVGALWCGWRWYQGATCSRCYLGAAAVLAAVGLLAHYDAIYIVPALTWLVLAGGWRRGWRAGQWLRELLVPVVIGGGLLGSFFVPFALNQRFARTFDYVVDRVNRDSASVNVFNNLGTYYRLATFYNTTFQMQWLALVLAAGLLAWLWMYVRPRWLGGGLVALFLVGCVLLVWAPQHFGLPGGGHWTIVAFGLPLAGLILAPATPMALRVLLLWFGAAFVAHAFLISSPRTHYYTIDTAAALLIGLTVARLVAWLRVRRWSWAQGVLAAGGCGIMLLATPYGYMVYVRQEPEYWAVFPEARPALYRASYGNRLPDGGYFGFPRRAGWKVLGELYRQGVLQGNYNSNEEELIAGWYTRGTFRCWQQPDYYFAAWSVASSTLRITVPPDYHLLGSVLVDHVKKLDIYSRAPVTQPPRIFALDEYRTSFETQAVGNFPLQRSLIEVVPQYKLDAAWQRDVLLRGYDLDRQRVQPGETATLVLYWRQHTTIEPGYAPVVTVRDSQGRTVASGVPHCDVPPEAWNAEYLSGVAFTITADERLPPGAYTVEVGLRQMQTGAWLPMNDGASVLPLATLTVTATPDVARAP